jgi:hypothetical protein
MMNITEYKVPKLLFIRGVFLKDCMPIDDIFEQKLMDQLNLEDDIVQQEPLPSMFNSMAQWPRNTNIKCWHCDLTFHDIPVFIPKGIDAKSRDTYNISTHGCFCSFNCAAAYNNLYNTKICNNINVREMLLFLYKVFNKKTVYEIPAAPSRYIMKQYCGQLDVAGYQLKIGELKNKTHSLEN